MTYLEQLAELREYGLNSQIRELNSVARKNKRVKPLISRSLIWPVGIKVGKWIRWEIKLDGKGAKKRTKEGKIIAVNKWHVTVHTGKYPESILLKNVLTGQVRFS